jgi:hypothetical protein
VIGATAGFNLSAANTGNIPLTDFIITDNVPPQMNVTRIDIGSTGFIQYQTNLNSTPTIFGGGALSLPAGEWVTVIQWVRSTIDPGETLTGSFRGTLISPDHNGDLVDEGDTINNTANLTYDFADSPGGPGSGTAGPAGASILVVPLPLPAFDKFSQGGVAPQWRFLIGQSVGSYRLTVDNDTGIALDALTMTDHIPPQFDVTSVTSGTYSNSAGVTTTVKFWRPWGRPERVTLPKS